MLGQASTNQASTTVNLHFVCECVHDSNLICNVTTITLVCFVLQSETLVGEQHGFRLSFFFKQNPFFSNQVRGAVCIPLHTRCLVMLFLCWYPVLCTQALHLGSMSTCWSTIREYLHAAVICAIGRRCLLELTAVLQIQRQNNTGISSYHALNAAAAYFYQVLTKTYIMLDDDEPVLEKSEGSTIDWLPGKNVTVKVLKKKPKKGSTAKPQTKTEQVDSFFNFFSPPQVRV